MSAVSITVNTGVTLTVTFTPNASLSAPVFVGISLSDDATFPIASGFGSLSTQIENKHTQYAMIPAGAPTKKTFTYHLDVLKFLGRSRYSTDVKASFGSNPTEAAFFAVWSCPADASYTVPAIFTTSNINYTCMLTEPKDLTQS